jgi:Family of unknown function (DUF6788)
MTSVTSTRGRRDALLHRLLPLARRAIFGTLSETYRTCGRTGCHCQAGAKHGPHLYVSFRGSAGTTAGYYVPQALGPRVRTGVAAWQALQADLRELAELNRRQLWASRLPRPTARRPRRRADGPTRVRPA